MKITDALRGEHGLFYALFEALERPKGDGAGPDDASAAVAFATVLESHAHLEDELLFRALEDSVGTDAGPLVVMRMEHEEIERTLAEMRNTTDAGRRRALQELAIGLAREHFAKEEQVLFHMAEQMLDEMTLQRLGDEWAGRRGVAV